MLFPVTVVGSWPRPSWLLQALRSRNRGEISYDEFNSTADDAVLLAIKCQEDAGVDILSDGEQRRDNFYSFVADRLTGIKMLPVAELLDYVEDKASFEQVLRNLDVPAFAIHSPAVIDLVRKNRSLALDDSRFLREHTSRKTKVTLPGPYMLLSSSWVKGLSSKIYPDREDLAKDLVRILREEVIALVEAGADFVQLDEPVLTDLVYGRRTLETFMCAALTYRADPSDELDFAKRLVNEVLAGVSGAKLGIHVCRGNWSKREEVLLEGNYAPLLPYLMDMKLDQLVLEFATPRAGELEVLSEYANEKELGLGVVNPRTDDVEPVNAIVRRVEEALRYFEPDKVYLNPDCGFGTFAERPVATSQVAFGKLKAIATAAQTLRGAYGA